jgi:hypothetical protein
MAAQDWWYRSFPRKREPMTTGLAVSYHPWSWVPACGAPRVPRRGPLAGTT